LNLLPEKKTDEIRDGAVLFDRMPQMFVIFDLIGVASPAAISVQIAPVPEVRDYPLYRALGDPDFFSDFPHTHGGRFREAQEHVRVVGKKSPG
jgi:hypothetical protein